MPHVCEFKVSPNSTFGLTTVNAILQCVERNCRNSQVKTLKYTECRERVFPSGKKEYFYPQVINIVHKGQK